MNETNVDEKVTSDDIVKKLSHGILVAFFSAVLLCCGLYGYVIYLHNGHIVEGQNRIIRIYDRQMKKMESTNPSVNIREKQREDEMKAFHQEVKNHTNRLKRYLIMQLCIQLSFEKYHIHVSHPHLQPEHFLG